MPVIITKGGTDYYLVPSPLVSFNRENYNNIGRGSFGASYNITLEGTLVPEKGNPYYDASADRVLLSTDDWTKAGGGADSEPSFGSTNKLASTLKKQEKIRSLFANDIDASGRSAPIVVNITEFGSVTGGLNFAGFVQGVDFGSDGRGVLPDTYTINLSTPNFIESAQGDFAVSGNEFNPAWQVSQVDETFEIAESDQINVNFNGYGLNVGLDSVQKFYTISRSLNAVGAPAYDENGNYVSGLAPWQQASGYIYSFLGLGSGKLPESRIVQALDIPNTYTGIAGLVMSESVNKEQGSYSVNEEYTLYLGDPVVHTISIDTSVEQTEKRTVSVAGSIQGLDTSNLSDTFSTTKNNYLNASGFNEKLNPNFGTSLSSDTYVIPSAYYYAKAFSQVDWLNPRPLSKSLGRDIAGGTLTYNYTFDDRPPSLVSGSVVETISVNDTYPGELFSATPVIGRNQPVLQYLNSRSEFKRNLSINVTMGQTTNNWSFNDAFNGYWSGANQANIQKWLLTDKPSRLNMSSGDLAMIYAAANPVNDPSFSVRNGKCFHSAPNESWDAIARTYSYSIEWTYEREV